MNILIIFALLFFSCQQETEIKVSEQETEIIQRDTIEKAEQKSLQQRIVEGVKKTLAQGYRYDLTMAYYVTEYNERGEYVGGQVFPGGDINPEISVCTDVVVRALRLAGVVDLQKALYEDRTVNRRSYPAGRSADPNIDHRRTVNLEVWFARHWHVINDNNDWQPGDIVVWDMTRNGRSDHIGIVSDKFENGRYWVIHNHPDPGYVAEEDKLFRWKITGHYRVKE